MVPAETTEGFDPDADRLPCSAAAPADPVSKVLEDDDLLMEIIVRVGFPTSLVHAALVCKRWFFHISNPAFLRRFRKLHPPRVLGFYVDTREELSNTRFVPMLPQPPELASVFRHASFGLDAYENERPYVMDCWKNNVLIRLVCKTGSEGPVKLVHKPLFPERGMAIVPQQPWHERSDLHNYAVSYLLIKEGGDCLSYFCVFIETTNQRTESTVYVYMFQNGGWCMITWATTELPYEPQLRQNPLLIGNKIYLLASPRDILVFDLRALSSSRIQLPQGVVGGKHFFTMNSLGLQCGGSTMLSRADDDLGVYLIHVTELHLVIWLHKGDNWLLVDTICLSEMCADLSLSDCRLASGNIGFVEITMVGPNAEFVLLETPLCILHWDIKFRTLRKVLEIRRNYTYPRRVHPLMMIWPPIFPALKNETARAD